MNDERLSVLIDRHLDGQLTDEERAEFEQLLRSSAAARTQFWTETRLHGLLREAAFGDAAERIVPLTPTRKNLTARVSLTALAASVIAVAALSAWIVALSSDRAVEPSRRAEATTSAVAILTRMADVRWDGTNGPLHAGAALNPGWIRFNSGLAQIEFFNGARILVEGPAELQLLSKAEVYCRSGKLSAEVPPQSRGFRIGTPHGDIVDLGTEFGLQVTPVTAEVHVFKGEVELHPTTALQANIREGEAVRVGNRAQPTPTMFHKAGFASVADLDRQSVEALRRRQAEWEAAGVRVNSDPSLQARFEFKKSNPFARTLPNVAASSQVHDATIVGCRWTEGRWPGKDALEFGRVSDRVRVEVPGEFRALTLSAWVRVQGLDRNYNSLFMADGFEPGEVHWQILNDGVVRLGVANPDGLAGSHVDYDSPVIFAPERFGQWVHLAVVYDGPGRQVKHYVDGRLASRRTAFADVPLRIGAAQIGNWDTGSYAISGPMAIRHFSGCMDAFELFARSLSEDEIFALYRMGTPQSDLIALTGKASAVAFRTP